MLAAFVAFSPAGVAAEGGAASEATLRLEGSQWRWEHTREPGGAIAAAPGEASRRYAIAFDEQGRLSIRADCQRVLGSWSVRDGVLELLTGPTTMAQCPEGSLANAFLSALPPTSRPRFLEGGLRIELAGERATVALVALSTELAGTRWRAIGYHDGEQSVVSVLPETEITARFESEGSVVGEAGCNRYQAPYQASDAALSIGPPALTRMHCEHPEGVMKQERRFLVALQQAASQHLDGDRLELRTANGELAVTFVADP